MEDYYTYYVHVLGISEELFWHADVSFLRNVAENKDAYEAWTNYEIDKIQKGD